MHACVCVCVCARMRARVRVCILANICYVCSLHPPWFSADCWEGTRATTVQLVAPPGANDLKVECLVELTEFFGDEAKSY